MTCFLFPGCRGVSELTILYFLSRSIFFFALLCLKSLISRITIRLCFSLLLNWVLLMEGTGKKSEEEMREGSQRFFFYFPLLDQTTVLAVCSFLYGHSSYAAVPLLLLQVFLSNSNVIHSLPYSSKPQIAASTVASSWVLFPLTVSYTHLTLPTIYSV